MFYLLGKQTCTPEESILQLVVTPGFSSVQTEFVVVCALQVLLNYFYRAMGMNVSSGACLQTTEFNAYDLITIDDAACLEPHSAVAAITFTARQDEDKFPLGSMSLKAAHVGKGAILGPQTQVTSCVVPDGAFVEPCTASSNPVQKNSYANPTDGAAVRTMHKPLAAWPALLAVLCFCVLSSLLSMPAVGEYTTGVWYASCHRSMLC